MKTRRIGLAIVAVLATACIAQASVIPLTVDTTGSAVGAWGSSHAATLNDTFVYNPLDPTATVPQQMIDAAESGSIADAFHANIGDVDAVLNYTLAHTTTALESTIVVDLWGRNEAKYNDASGEGLRDNDVEIQLLSGGTAIANGTVTGIQLSQGLANVYGGAYARATFAGLAEGTTFDGMRIIGHDSNGPDGHNYFTLMETRIAAIPEPATLGMVALFGGGILFIRRKLAM